MLPRRCARHDGRERRRRRISSSREPTLHRIETGKVPVTVASVRALCWLYGTDESVTADRSSVLDAVHRARWCDGFLPRWRTAVLTATRPLPVLSSLGGAAVPQVAGDADVGDVPGRGHPHLDRVVGRV